MTTPRLFSSHSVRSASCANRVVVWPVRRYAAVDDVVQHWHAARPLRVALSYAGGTLIKVMRIEETARDIIPFDMPLRRHLSTVDDIPNGLQTAARGGRDSASETIPLISRETRTSAGFAKGREKTHLLASR